MGGSYENATLYLQNKNVTVSDEREIIDKILKEGDKHAFELLVEQYKKPLLKHLINMTGNVGLSLELLQETFLRVWIYLDTYSFDRTFFPWICKIATNVAIKHKRMENNVINKKISLDEIDVDSLIILDENMNDKAFIQSMINSLEEPYKTAMFFRFIEDRDYKNIASMMNVTPNQVKKYLFRAKKILKKSWEKNNFQKN
jgi:RNA polymerase sigma-70 factor (ECF subfamily)